MIDEKEIERLTEKAEQGDIEAQIELGYTYFYNEDGTRDYTKQAYWFGKAAEQGDIKALIKQGHMYHLAGEAQQAARCTEEATKLLENSQEQGLADAQFELGYAYFTGHGCEKDYATAFHWFLKAAEQGIPRAQFFTAVSYNDGYGVKQDLAEAARWFEKAAEQGDVRSQFEIGRRYYDGYGIEINKEKALHWLTKSAQQEFQGAMRYLVIYYIYEGDKESAIHWYEKCNPNEKEMLKEYFGYDDKGEDA